MQTVSVVLANGKTESFEDCRLQIDGDRVLVSTSLERGGLLVAVYAPGSWTRAYGEEPKRE